MVTISTHFYNQGGGRGSLKKKINKTKKRRRLGKKTKKRKNKKRKGRSMKTKKLKISDRKRNMLGGGLIQHVVPRLKGKLLEIGEGPSNITNGLEKAISPFGFYLVCTYMCGNTTKYCVVKEMVVENGTLESITGTSAAMAPGTYGGHTPGIITYVYDQMLEGKAKELISDIKDKNGVMLCYLIDPNIGQGTVIIVN